MTRLGIDDPDLPLADMMDRWPDVIPVFLRHRMLCVGCLIAPFHTLSDACREYGLDERAFLAELQRAVAMAI
jgi:hybrid cluster-associated redox disulfide protein